MPDECIAVPLVFDGSFDRKKPWHAKPYAAFVLDEQTPPDGMPFHSIPLLTRADGQDYMQSPRSLGEQHSCPYCCQIEGKHPVLS